MTITELREIQALNTLVFETLGQPEKEREFKFKSLKRWGLDLIAGKKDGKATFFVSEYGKRKAGDIYDEEGIQYEVTEILYEIPKNKKLFAHIEMENGRAYLVGELRENDKNIEILRLPAASMLLAYFKKHRLHHLIEALRNVGTATELVKQRGQEGKPYSFEQLPNVARRFLREAKKVEKEAGFGRVALAYFGENKDGDPRFRVSWLLPTIALFEIDIAEKADKILAAFK
ncbi:TIGR00703 family protein [Desulfurobacterium indicum]|uniref:TIGR00703 family protein n=1 Tax=Desulfurobacterium indicum TaxID=1914305 RepID=A0A1R1MMK6_9BACT|nr:TIGR00703 family protein [Desulfurobacterium indicum]OMH41051.1 TIGR00703 family protein [Desulfurobacterium indicum]